MIINPYRFAAPAPPSLIVDEDFEGDGRPPGWTDTQGTPNYDSLTWHSLNGKALHCASNQSAKVDAAGTSIYVKCLWQPRGDPGQQKWHLVLRDSGGTYLLGLVHDNVADRATIRINGGNGPLTSTFSIPPGRVFYCWLEYVSGGACYVGMNTADSRPADGIDTATAFGIKDTDIVSGTVDYFQITNYGTDHYLDDVQISSTASIP